MNNDDRGIIIFFSIIIMLGFGGLVYKVYQTHIDYSKGSEILRVTEVSAGKINNIWNCTSHKHSYTCNVTTDKWDFGRRDISEFEDKPLMIGLEVSVVEKLTPSIYWKKFCIYDRCPWDYEQFSWRDQRYKERYKDLMGEYPTHTE